MSKRGQEKKVKEDEEATAHVFQEFLRSFQELPVTGKTFVKSGVFYGDRNVVTAAETELYQPVPVIQSSVATQQAIECATIVKLDPLSKKKDQTRKKSNLELLKEELKLRHSEREERDKLKEEIQATGPALSYFDGGDPKSTNLFVANLRSSVTEVNLMEEFGVFGPLASVKIMWPRGEEKFKNMTTNCGFVAFMSRRDAERALNVMKNRSDMRVGWGKSVDLPTHPIYIPKELLKMFLPPPQTGLAFNAQPPGKFNDHDDLDCLLRESVVKVTIPLNKKMLALVNRMVEFVVKEGPLFEAMIMNREMQNPDYGFLFENKSATHLYYRWKLFSVLQGDSTKIWRMKPFRMFEGGSIWLPPTAPDYNAGMPEHLTVSSAKEADNTSLSDNQCERLIEIIRNLTLSKTSIADGMVFCLNHLPALKDSLDIIVDSLCQTTTKPVSKIARLFLLSDVLSNCKSKTVLKDYVPFEKVMNELKRSLDEIKNDADKGIFKKKVQRFLQQMHFIDFISEESSAKYENYFRVNLEGLDDGNSSSDEPLDGASLLKRSMKNPSQECVITSKILRERQQIKIRQEYFVPSKWDTLDPDEVETQSMTSAKLYQMDREAANEKENLDVLLPIKSTKSKKRKRDKYLVNPESYSTKKDKKKRTH